jgi:hypothetical protein
VSAASLEELEPRHSLRVEDHDLAVEQQRPVRQGRDRGGDAGERLRPVVVVPGQEAHARALLVREDPVAVVLLLVDPAGVSTGSATSVASIGFTRMGIRLLATPDS